MAFQSLVFVAGLVFLRSQFSGVAPLALHNVV